MTSAHHYTAVLLLADGAAFYGHAVGAPGVAPGELCFNTAMTGYQEILTDPSYAGQIITFTFPHIGNTGVNDEDAESQRAVAQGLVLREDITAPSNWRQAGGLDAWLRAQQVTGICGVDTRALTRRLRLGGAVNGLIYAPESGRVNPDMPELAELRAKLAGHPSLEGEDLVSRLDEKPAADWREPLWSHDNATVKQPEDGPLVVALDFGMKDNIARHLVSRGCRVRMVPGRTPVEEILALKPDGVFLSNGPGDPAATGAWALPTIRALLEKDLPLFGICLGHQLLALALGAQTEKMFQGHRGANHPVLERETGKVEITSHNHGFTVSRASLPSGVKETHTSLFDDTVQGIRLDGRPVFSVQYHPEASPGPHDSGYLFGRFVDTLHPRHPGAGRDLQEP